MKTAELRMIPVAELKPAEYNPRKKLRPGDKEYEKIKNSIAELIASCQRSGCDPFGFAESAAGHFATVPGWLAFDWHERYRRARINVDVTLSAATNP